VTTTIEQRLGRDLRHLGRGLRRSRPGSFAPRRRLSAAPQAARIGPL